MLRVSPIVLVMIVLQALFHPPAHAGLAWDRSDFAARPEPGAQRVEGTFRFTNAGPAPVTILEVKSSCDCTTAVADKKTYAPGERGRITAVFIVGNRVGMQHKRVFVKTDARDNPDAILTLNVELPSVASLEPRHLYWKTGDPPVPRRLKITATADVQIVGVRATDSRGGMFETEVRELRKGKEYELVVTPRQTVVGAMSPILIDLRLADDRTCRLSAPALIHARDHLAAAQAAPRK